ncbi:MAG TPA: hypothetical protein VMA95_16365 [Streptosporangiaceae bacterium]|nr:hypothetical protein [Streptosporangiaceae bacterium]
MTASRGSFLRWKSWAVFGLTAAAIGIGIPVGISLAAGGQPDPPDPAPLPTTITDSPPAYTGPLVPASGAYLGAYVQPKSYTSQGQVAAVRAFQARIGAKLALVHVYHPWPQPFPSAADRQFVKSGKVLLLTWGGTPDTKKIIAGTYNKLITERAEAVKALHRPILLEFRHEMDRPNLQRAVHGPKNYIKAWDHIRAIFSAVGATNVGWVWCPTGYGFQVGRAQAFYPGNNEVDWVCADVYTVTPGQSLQQAAAPFMRWAAGTGKPVIIGEFASNDPPSAWPAFLTAAGQFAESNPQIKAIAYFDANGSDSNGNPFKYWLGSHQKAIAAFARLAAMQYFQPAIPSGS